jgi:tetratricopeptide (TPR) repeat protein
MTRWTVFALVLVAAGPGLITSGGAADSPLLAEFRAFWDQYHRDPARLDVLRERLRKAAGEDATLDNLIAFAHISFIWGDVRGRSREEKLAAYDEGREAARRAVALAPQSVLAHIWFASNTGRWGQVNGVVRSLFLLPTVKAEMQKILELDPNFAPGYVLAGQLYLDVPGIAGGDLDRAEAMFRKGLTIDAHFTSLRIGLARTLIKKGRIAEARRELQAVVDEKAPTNLADWTVKDVPRARQLLSDTR